MKNNSGKQAILIVIAAALSGLLVFAIMWAVGGHGNSKDSEKVTFNPQSLLGEPSWKASYELRVHGYSSVMGYEPTSDWTSGVEIVASEPCGSHNITVKAIYTGKTPGGRALLPHTALIAVDVTPASRQEILDSLSAPRVPDSVCQAAIAGANAKGQQ